MKTERWREDRQARDLEAWEWHSREFPGFSFCFEHLRLGTGEANLETPTGKDRKDSNEK